MEGVWEAGKERAVQLWKVGKMEENYKTMPNILQQKRLG